jgi:orotidine-5'-phosphate decarboxylase
MHPADRLLAVSRATGSVACVGFDPRPALIPTAIAQDSRARLGDTRHAVADAFARWGEALVPAIAGRCCAIKPQVACYEAYGAPGIAALERTIAAANAAGIPVIVDAKRGDIGSTAEHYAQAWIGAAQGFDGRPLPGVDADWITVNAYLGSDGVEPFSATGKGVFLLVRTSNPSAKELQERRLDDGLVYEAMGRLVHAWGAARRGTTGLSALGAVVGATAPAQAKALRALMPDTVFLVPGYGAQGGTAADALAGLRPDGTGAVVNASRSIIGAWTGKPGDWREACVAALDAMNADLKGVR